MQIDKVWSNLQKCEGEVFHQIRGKPFTYRIKGQSLALTTTNRSIPRSQIERALERLPVTNTMPFQDLQGPSYVFALLNDSRIIGD